MEPTQPNFRDGRVFNWGYCNQFDQIDRNPLTTFEKNILWLKNKHSTCYNILNYRISSLFGFALNCGISAFSIHLAFVATPWALLGVAIVPLSFALSVLHKKFDHLDQRVHNLSTATNFDHKYQAIENTKAKFAKKMEKTRYQLNQLQFYHFHHKHFGQITESLAIGIDDHDDEGYANPFIGLRIAPKSNPFEIFTVFFQQKYCNSSEWEEKEWGRKVIQPQENQTKDIMRFFKRILKGKHDTYQLA